MSKQYLTPEEIKRVEDDLDKNGIDLTFSMDDDLAILLIMYLDDCDRKTAKKELPSARIKDTNCVKFL